MNEQQNVNFGVVLDYLRNGGYVARPGWNKRTGQSYVYLKKGSRDISEGAVDVLPVGASNVDGIPFNLFDQGDAGTYTRYPGLRMSDSKHRTSDWVPTILDVLAEDWSVYPNWIVETETIQG